MTAKELIDHLNKLGVEYVVTTRSDPLDEDSRLFIGHSMVHPDSPNLIGIRFWVDEENDLTLS
jgi:hypothetical protein|tara:strand:- start:221 stop:409 length:189 start_codon:yes stop_codon:yes gene_type:complete